MTKKITKKKQKSVIKKLLTTAENLWKEVCRLRDGNKCQGLKMEKDHKCSGPLQVDHCFSRKVSQLFIEIGNGTTICSSLHFRKTHCIRGAEKLVDEFVKAREGEDWWKNAKAVCASKKPNVWEASNLEEKINYLKKYREVLKNPGVIIE